MRARRSYATILSFTVIIIIIRFLFFFLQFFRVPLRKKNSHLVLSMARDGEFSHC